MNKLACSINETVAMSGMSRSAIYRAIKEKRIPKRKNGGRTLILVSDLERFLQSLPQVEA